MVPADIHDQIIRYIRYLRRQALARFATNRDAIIFLGWNRDYLPNKWHMARTMVYNAFRTRLPNWDAEDYDRYRHYYI